MELTKKDKFVMAAVIALIGVLFIILKGGVISYAMTASGILLIVLSIFDFIDGNFPFGVVKAVIGVVVIVFGWALVKVALYILAAALLILGILQIYTLFKLRVRGSFFVALALYLKPVLSVVVAIFLFIRQGETMDWIFIVSGIALILEAATFLIDGINMKEVGDVEYHQK